MDLSGVSSLSCAAIWDFVVSAKDILLSVVSSFFAAFGGAYFAFRYNIMLDLRKESCVKRLKMIMVLHEIRIRSEEFRRCYLSIVEMVHKGCLSPIIIPRELNITTEDLATMSMIDKNLSDNLEASYADYDYFRMRLVDYNEKVGVMTKDVYCAYSKILDDLHTFLVDLYESMQSVAHMVYVNFSKDEDRDYFLELSKGDYKALLDDAVLKVKEGQPPKPDPQSDK